MVMVVSDRQSLYVFIRSMLRAVTAGCLLVVTRVGLGAFTAAARSVPGRVEDAASRHE